jgi:hypothetical protein
MKPMIKIKHHIPENLRTRIKNLLNIRNYVISAVTRKGKQVIEAEDEKKTTKPRKPNDSYKRYIKLKK